MGEGITIFDVIASVDLPIRLVAMVIPLHTVSITMIQEKSGITGKFPHSVYVNTQEK